MEDIIDIIVTETTNTIEITSQGTDEIIDVNIIDNREDITLNVTPTVVEININSLTGNFGVTWGEITGTLSNQTDLNTALGLKADLVGGKVPSSQLPSYVDDIVEVANYAALPATGETGKIYVVLDTNKIYRWSGSAYIEIADSTAVWGAITGTLSSQTDLQTALNAKFDDPTGDTTQYIAGDGSLITFPVAGQSGTLVREVRNTTGATLTKGTIVYISGATGNKPTVSKAIATGDSTSAQTFGMCQANISNNSNGYVVCVGDLGGLDTSALTEGAQLYLSSTTAGEYTTTKQLAPAHLVYIGVVTRAHPTLGQIEVKIQNGYELDEIHDVAISSVANNDGLFYESSTDLWKNKSIATVLGYTPANGANYLPLAGGTMTGAILGTTATFTNAGSGIGLGVTLSGATGDGIKITHSAGRAFNILSSAGGYGIIINNETAATSIPFLIQKQGANKIGLYDDGSSSFSGTLSAPTINISNSAANNALYITQGNSTYNAVVITNTGGTALYATGAVTVIGTGTYTGVLTAQAGLANGTGQAFTFGTTSGTLAITSQLSAYLPLSGGTLTGALSGTSATFSGNVGIGTSSPSDFIDATTGLAVMASSGRAGVTIGSTQETANEVLGRLSFTNTNSSNAGSKRLAYISGIRGTTDNSAYLEFGTADNGLGTQRMVISQAGNVGIGTTSPSVALEINGASNLASRGRYVKTSEGILQLGANRGTSNCPYIGSENAYDFAFITNDTERMRITSGGAIKISAGSPPSSGDGLEMWYNGTNSVIGSIDRSTSTNKQLYFFGSNTIFENGGSERMRITSGGDVIVNATTNTLGGKLATVLNDNGYALSALKQGTFGAGILVRVDNTNSDYIRFFYSSSNTQTGSINTNGTTTTYNVTSDYRLKEDLKAINGLEIVNKINVYDYKWKSDNTRMDGVLAHELAEVLPYAVTGEKDGERMQGVDYSKIVPVMVQAIKELKAELDTLKNK